MEATLEILLIIWQLKAILLGLLLGGMLFCLFTTLAIGYLVLTIRLCYDMMDVKHWYFSAQKALRDNIGNTTIRWPGQAEVLAWKSLLLR